MNNNFVFIASTRFCLTKPGHGHPLEGLTLEQGCALIVASPALVRFEVQRDGDPPTVELTTIRTIPSRDIVHTDQ